MSKNTKKLDFGTDPRSKSLDTSVLNNIVTNPCLDKSALNLQGLVSKGKGKRMPPPQSLSNVPKKENITETTSTRTKQWGPAATPDTPDKTGRGDWASASLPYQPRKYRNAIF